MNKNVAMIRKIGGLGLAGVLAFGASNAAAEDFDATVSVQNALAITNIQAMNFGTLFAANANASAAAQLDLAPGGGISEGTGLDINGTASTDAPSFLSLGGATAAAQGTVSPSNNVFTVTVPAGDSSADLTATGDFATNATAVDAGDVIEMIIDSGNTSVARFYLADFTLAAVSGADSVSQTGSDYEITPTFNSDVVFAVGASIFTDASGTRTTYQQGTYTGTFEVEATF